LVTVADTVKHLTILTVVASRIWNCLPLHVTSAPSLDRLPEEEAGAVFVQTQFFVLIYSSCNFVFGLAALGLYALHS